MFFGVESKTVLKTAFIFLKSILNLFQSENIFYEIHYLAFLFVIHHINIVWRRPKKRNQKDPGVSSRVHLKTALTVNQVGLCMGLVSETMSAFEMTRRLFAAGILVLPAHYDSHAIEFRPILILRENEAETIIRIVRDTLG